MISIDRNDLEQYEHLYKINLVNSLSGYKSANLLGTISEAGVTNVAVFSSVTHMGSSPPLLGFFLRPTTVPRNTYKNILETEVFTINHISREMVEDAHHTSAKYKESVSEFDVTNLDPLFRATSMAPFVAQSPIQLAMRYQSTYPIKENNTLLILGEIENIYIQENLLQEDGFIDLSKGEVATINALDAYAIPKRHERLAYQRPK
ncbi:MAG: flavin reductase [Flavobacteriaceae bacterium]|nr:flavin reductase [Flavobacteriaceae bacterium]